MYEVTEKGITRNGIVVADIVNGDIVMRPEQIKYQSHVVRLYNNLPEKKAIAQVAKTQPQTVREWIDILTPIADDPCPAIKAWLGDSDPAVLDWINRNKEKL